MKGSWKEFDKEKVLFKTVYCLGCNQKKVCDYCSCAYQMEQERAEEYSDYEKLLASRQREQKEKFQQY